MALMPATKQVTALSAGDVSGDGIDDVLIAAISADPGGDSSAGEVYIVYGSSSAWSSTFNLSSINGTNGILINGIDATDTMGSSLSVIGDINDDNGIGLCDGCHRW